MRIVTYNFLRAGSLNRCGHWSREIRNLKPDLTLAQECRPPQSSPGERFRHDEPDAFAWQPAGSRVIAFPEVGGLHHRYERVA